MTEPETPTTAEKLALADTQAFRTKVEAFVIQGEMAHLKFNKTHPAGRDVEGYQPDPTYEGFKAERDKIQRALQTEIGDAFRKHGGDPDRSLWPAGEAGKVVDDAAREAERRFEVKEADAVFASITQPGKTPKTVIKIRK